MAFEEENINTYGGLHELNGSDWEIKDGEPDISGWSVFNSLGDKLAR